MRPRPSSENVGRINVAPLIDVVMCLIVFFLLVGNLAAHRIAAVDLPETGTGETGVGGDPLVVNLQANAADEPVVVIEGVELDLRSAGRAIAEMLAGAPDRPVQVRASRRLTYGPVRELIEICREAGVRQVQLSAYPVVGGGGAGGAGGGGPVGGVR